MGLFRFVLASFVMLQHFHAFYPHALPFFVNGNASVPAFYTVSGFLITLVMNSEYKDRITLFYTNRLLRIYPVYWVALAAFVVVNLLVVNGYVPHPRGEGIPDYRPYSALLWNDTHPLTTAELIPVFFVNVFIVGRDLILFIGRWPNLMTPDYFYHYQMYVGPAWTIALELSFYVIAPFVVRSVRRIAILMVLSLGVRLIGIGAGRLDLIESYSMFPLELVFFMAGSLSCHALPWLRARKPPFILAYGLISWSAVVVLSAFYPSLPFARVIYLVTVPLCLPGMYLMGRYNPLDKILGDLSYPMYLLHPLLILAMVPGDTLASELAAMCIVITVSLGVVKLVERPIDRYRKQRLLTRRFAAPPDGLTELTV